MTHKIHFLLALLLAMMHWSTTYAQDTVMISKAEILSKINTENLQIKIAEKTSAAARADFRQSNALFLPNISASHTAMVTTNPLMAFGSKLNQGIVTPADFNPAVLNDPGRTQNYATLLEFSQPLINVDGLYERKAAKTTLEIYELQAARTKEYLALDVSKAYMQLQLAHRAVLVLQKAHETASSSLQMVKNYFAQGMLQKSDVLDVEIRVNEIYNQWQSAKSNVQNASDYLSFLMNETGGQKIYMPIEEMETTLPAISSGLSVPESRKDVLAMNKSAEAYAQMYTSRKMNFLPRLNAFGSYQMYDSKLFGTNSKGYLLGAQLSWTLFDGYKSLGLLEKNKVNYEKSLNETEQYKAQSDLELNKTIRQLSDSENQVKNAKLAHELAQESYRIRKDRFEQGLVKTNELMTSEALQFQKELEYLQSLFAYHFTKEYIDFLTK
jgi:outer membrane protein TolC